MEIKVLGTRTSSNVMLFMFRKLIFGTTYQNNFSVDWKGKKIHGENVLGKNKL